MYKKRAEIIVTGHVQGVNFRYDIKKKADELNLSGQVKNLETVNQVEIIAEGEEEDIEKIISWCKSGNIYTKIENVDAEWQKPEGKFNEFEIIY